MANRMTGGEEYASGTRSKKLKPGVAKRVSDRKAFVDKKVGEKGITRAQARQRFYVQTRMAEMKAKGKTVTPEMRKKLQQKFQSGDVARKGFAAPKKKTGGSSSSSSSSSSSAVTSKATTKVAPRSATSNMKPIAGWGRTDSSGRTGMGATASPKSAASQEYGAVDSKGNFSGGKNVAQHIRVRDTVLRGRPKPAYKNK